MDEVVLVSLITGVFMCATTIITAVFSSKLTSHRIGELEKKMNAFDKLHDDVIILTRDSKTMWRKVDDITNKVEDLRND